MLTPIANCHNSKLPKPGTLGYITGGRNRLKQILWWGGRPRKCIVESFALADSDRALRWVRRSRELKQYHSFWTFGIHCVTVRFLDNGERLTIAAHYFREREDL